MMQHTANIWKHLSNMNLLCLKAPMKLSVLMTDFLVHSPWMDLGLNQNFAKTIQKQHMEPFSP